MSLQKSPPGGLRGVNKEQIHWEEDLKPFTRLPREEKQSPKQRAPWWIPALVSAAVILFACSTLYSFAQRQLPTRNEIQSQLNAVLNPTPTRPVAFSSPTPDVRPTATLFVAPTAVPTAGPTARPGATAAPAAVNLAKGGFARVDVAGGANFRETTSPNAKLLSRLALGSVHQIVDGPVNAENFTWWQLKTPDGVTGWTVEGNIVGAPRPGG